MIYGPTDDNASPTWVLAVAQMDNKIPLMQFTGLLDKNGKEIYEGDILFWDESNIGWVTFEHAEFIVGIKNDPGARALCAAREEELEVLGNIHENPELLK